MLAFRFGPIIGSEGNLPFSDVGSQEEAYACSSQVRGSTSENWKMGKLVGQRDNDPPYLNETDIYRTTRGTVGQQRPKGR